MKTKFTIALLIAFMLAAMPAPALADGVPYVECVVVVGAWDVPMYTYPTFVDGITAYIPSGTKLLGSRHPEIAPLLEWLPGWEWVAYNGQGGYVLLSNTESCLP